MREILTSIDVDASPERVWEVLTVFDAYGEWNPFARVDRGNTRAGFEAMNEAPKRRAEGRVDAGRDGSAAVAE